MLDSGTPSGSVISEPGCSERATMGMMQEKAGRLRERVFESMGDGAVTERLFSAVPDVVYCMKNLDGVYVSANEAFAARLGLGSRWDVVGRRAGDLFPAAQAAHYERRDAEVLRGEDGSLQGL